MLKIRKKGFEEVYMDSNNAICSITTTKIPNKKNISGYLIQMGVTIKGTTLNGKYYKCILPTNWYHYVLNNGTNAEIIYDHNKKMRVWINEKDNFVNILPRYSYDVEVTFGQDTKVPTCKIIILDGGMLVSNTYLDKKLLTEISMRVGFDKEIIVSECRKEIESQLDNSFPEWRNPLAYWNEEN